MRENFVSQNNPVWHSCLLETPRLDFDYTIDKEYLFYHNGSYIISSKKSGPEFLWDQYSYADWTKLPKSPQDIYLQEREFTKKLLYEDELKQKFRTDILIDLKKIEKNSNWKIKFLVIAFITLNAIQWWCRS